MYRGGILADASICDYESSRKLGLVCPFCSEAVFLRRGSEYDRNGKPVKISPAFCHYGIEGSTGEECELRSIRKEGERYLQNLEIQARNQRLELYNKRLWEVMKQEWHVTSLKEVKQAFAGWAEQRAKKYQKEIAQNIDLYLREADKQWEFTQKDLTVNPSREDIYVWSEAERIMSALKFSSFDREMHKLIYKEIIRFVSTNSGKYAFNNIFLLLLIQLCANAWVEIARTPAKSNLIIGACAKKVKIIKENTFPIGVVILIVQTNWIKLFYSLEDKK